jgi:hypothetical protein
LIGLLDEDRPLGRVAGSAYHSAHHFKRLVGVTPGQFRKSARNA